MILESEKEFMKVVMKTDESFKKGQQWNKKGLDINKEFRDEDFVDFDIYDELGGVIAQFTVCLNPTMIASEINRIQIFDKNVNRHQLIKEFINYIYTEQTDFKVLVLRVHIQESGFKNFDLQCAGFYTNTFFTWYHLNPNYEEVINMGTNDKEIKEMLQEKISKMCLNKEKYIEKIQKQLEISKIDLAELEREGNIQMATYKRQEMENYEAILNANESSGLSR